MAAKIMIKCGHCDGHGEVQLASHLREVLILIPADGELPTGDIWREFNVGRRPWLKRTALLGRLWDLCSFGLIARRKDGKFVYWRRL